MTFICEGGDKISAHGMMVLRHCPQLRMIFAKFSCCYCHGTDCGGCDRKDNIMTVSLPDFKKSTLVSFLELLYTGRTFFTVSQKWFYEINSLEDIAQGPNHLYLDGRSLSRNRFSRVSTLKWWSWKENKNIIFWGNFPVWSSLFL